MIPHTKELVKKMKGKPFVFVSVSVDEMKATSRSSSRKRPCPGRSGAAARASVETGIDGLPDHLHPRRQGGHSQDHRRGRQEEIDKEVEKLVKKAQAPRKTKTE